MHPVVAGLVAPIWTPGPSVPRTVMPSGLIPAARRSLITSR